MPPIALRGLPIAITGASSGIGRAVAIACAAAGMPVALAARREDRLEGVAARIRQDGGTAIAIPTDVDRPDDCERLVRAACDALGPLYAVFANAGYSLEGPVLDTPDAEARAIFQTNFFGTLATIRPAARVMLEQGRGHILICSSCLSKIAVPGHGFYSATKAAQDHVGRALRHDLRARGVFVSTVHPVGTHTELHEAGRSVAPASSAPARLATPARFMQPPERVASAVVRCLRRPRSEVWTSGLARWAFALGVAMPGLADAALARAAARGRPRRPQP